MILFLDTISPKPKFILFDNNKIVQRLHILKKDELKISDHIHSKFLELKNKNNLYNSLDKLIVCKGPGSFTSLRIGISFMLGISYSRNLPIYSLSSIDILGSFVLEKNFYNTIILTCSSNKQNFISIPHDKNKKKYLTYKFDEKYILKKNNFKFFLNCITNFPINVNIKKNIYTINKKIKFIEKKIENNLVKNLNFSKKQNFIIQPEYISENKIFDE